MIYVYNDNDNNNDDINLCLREPPKGYKDVLSLGFKYKVLFIKMPKTTRGKKTPL
jgi:hypothetical protein